VKKFLAIVLSIAALVLTGCSQVDSAASVGDSEIALADLQSQVDLILSEREGIDTTQMQLEDGEALTRSQLSYMISNLIIAGVADEQKVEVTKAEIDAYKIEIFANIGGEENLPNVLVSASTSLDDVLRRDLILRKISEREAATGSDDAAINERIQTLVTEKAKALGITVNPRYGTWDAATLSVIATDPAGDAVTDK
jgi:hypothetical protein